MDVEENEEILKFAADINQQGINKMDSLHIACVFTTGAKYFLTTDDRVLKKDIVGYDIHVTDPIGFIKEVPT